MSVYPLAALNKNRDDLVPFSIKDGPCPVDKECFMLMNRPGTPILRYDSIVKGLDIPNVFEGDIIEHKGKEFIVKYQRGFNAISLDGDIISLDTDFNVKTNMYFQDKFDIVKPAVVKFRIKGGCYCIDDIFGTDRGKIVINSRSIDNVYPNELDQYAGMRLDGNKVYFGTSNNTKVYLNKGIVIIRRD